MRILCISEHFFPRVGGTVHYVHETCSALSALGHEVCLVVPATAATPTDGFAYRVVALGAGYPDAGEPSRAARYAFCEASDVYAQAAARDGRAEVVHVLYGMYLAETLNVEDLHAAGARTVVTIHNVPPQECRRTWPDSSTFERLADEARLRAVGWVNRRRLKRQRFGLYVAPSKPVEDIVRAILPGVATGVIGHGPTSDLQALISAEHRREGGHDGRLRILTVGGWAPHKGQHLVPRAAEVLRSSGMDFSWRMIGPDSRVPGYRASVERGARALHVDVHLDTAGALPWAAVAGAYREADVYVQPSFEEGFCITALDAARAGLPVVGTRAGALPLIASVSRGQSVAPRSDEIAQAILNVAARQADRGDRHPGPGIEQFSWHAAARSLTAMYAAI